MHPGAKFVSGNFSYVVLDRSCIMLLAKYRNLSEGILCVCVETGEVDVFGPAHVTRLVDSEESWEPSLVIAEDSDEHEHGCGCDSEDCNE